jgi:hypothetical protein
MRRVAAWVYDRSRQITTETANADLSETYAVGTADESMTAPILQFIQAPPR